MSKEIVIGDYRIIQNGFVNNYLIRNTKTGELCKTGLTLDGAKNWIAQRTPTGEAQGKPGMAGGG